MIENLGTLLRSFYYTDIVEYIQSVFKNPIQFIPLIIDITIVAYLIITLIKILKGSRAWQLVKGIVLLIIITGLSSLFQLHILNYILTTIMTYGVILIVVVFQPELRRALEQLGTNKLTKFFGIDKDIQTRLKEDIYKIVIATKELASNKIGALIVLEREIKIKDKISTRIAMEAEISPQLLVNIFTPNTPLHDGAVIISNNKISAAACMLPLASDQDIAKELGTRHRAAIGVSKESDALAVVVSEETGHVSVAGGGRLTRGLTAEELREQFVRIQNKRKASRRLFARQKGRSGHGKDS